MMASNYPVDKFFGVGPQRLLNGMAAIFKDLPESARSAICVGTAKRFYKLA
jgi:predicted TIM-barrel fold metal-dependent hydrolase